MKLKQVGAICKEAGIFMLYDQYGDDGKVTGQWLGTGCAIFKLSGLPLIGEDHIAALFGFTEKQLGKLLVKRGTLPGSINFDDTDPAEVALDDGEITFAYGKYTARPLVTRQGLEFIDNKFLTPLSDDTDYLMIYERSTANGQTYFALKIGLMIVGVVMPLNIIEDKFVESVEALAKKARTALEHKKEQDAQRKKGAADEED